MSGKLDGRSYAGTPKNFQSTHVGYRAHRAVIFAIAWHLVYSKYLSENPIGFFYSILFSKGHIQIIFKH